MSEPVFNEILSGSSDWTDHPADTHVPSRSPESPVSDSKAAREAYDHYKETWDITHLDTAIHLFQRAADTASEPDGNMLGWLGLCLADRYATLGNLDDLERALAARQHALELVPEDHPDKALRLSSLAYSLQDRFERLGEIKDLEHAIAAQSRAAELTPDGHPVKAATLNNLGDAWHSRFARLGEIDDLEKGIAAQKRAVELTPDGHPSKPTRLNNLGGSLQRRFEHLGELDDLEKAIVAKRRAVELTSDGDPSIPTRLNNLGGSLHRRFERLGELDDLEQSIATKRRAVELTPDEHPSKATRLSNLGESLHSRFGRLGELDDLEQAIAVQRRAVELTADENPSKPIWLNNLGDALHSRFNRLRVLDDLEQAIVAQRRALELLPDRHPNEPTWLNNLGSSLETRYERLGELDDLKKAIAAQRRALELTPEGVPAKAIRLKNLGISLIVQLREENIDPIFEEALSCFMIASADAVGSSSSRLDAAEWSVGILSDYPTFSTPQRLLSAHSLVIDILPEIVWLGHSIKRRFEESSRLGHMVNAAVHVAVDTGACSQAVEWLEAGRSLIWSQVLSLRDPIDELEKHHPDLAHTLKQIQAQLQNTVHASFLSTEPVTATSGPDTFNFATVTNVEADHHRGLAVQYGSVLANVRRQPGFEDFMRPKKLPALLSCSAHLNGPVVFVNVSSARSDALILVPDGTIKAVALPELSSGGVEKLCTFWTVYLRQRHVRERSTSLISLDSDEGPDSGIIRMLGLLWTWIVHPVLESLGLSNSTDRSVRLPHITWCPTGSLTQMPLHAAGLYDDDTGPRVYDLVVSSYTPSLSALTRSLEASAKQLSLPSVLVVTQPNTPGLSPLRGTKVEGARLQTILSDHQIPSSVFEGKQALVDDVRKVMDKHPWLHLACHGSQNRSDPVKSAFALYDGPLSLESLMTTVSDSDDAELAFLSACQTAVGDAKIPEESMHLAAGMLAVGFKGVIATMWSIQDDVAPLVVEAYYSKLLELRASGTLHKGETGAAYALHEATKQLREKVGEKEFVCWAPFVHFGI